MTFSIRLIFAPKILSFNSYFSFSSFVSDIKVYSKGSKLIFYLSSTMLFASSNNLSLVALCIVEIYCNIILNNLAGNFSKLYKFFSNQTYLDLQNFH